MNKVAEFAQILNKKILIVEDSKVNQLVLISTLKRFGLIDIHTSNNGKEALDLVMVHNFDIILMDCQMPIMDGFEATTHIRCLQNQNANIPIIAVTANVSSEYQKQCFECGMSGFIAKPIDLDEFREKLFYHLINATH